MPDDEAPVLDIEHLDTTIRAVDRANNVSRIEVTGWDPIATERPIPYALDATTSGRVNRLSFSSWGTSVGRVVDGTFDDHDAVAAREDHDIGEGDFILELFKPIHAFIAFAGPATLSIDHARRGTLTFAQPTPVTVGFRSHLHLPRDSVTVPPTPEGLAAAISHFPYQYAATGPIRTASLSRKHPPRIRYGDAIEIPPAVERPTTTTGIELRLPDSFASLVPAASLATYLGARVTVSDRDRPRLVAPSADLDRTFSPMPRFQHEAAELLRRVFYLDMLVRVDVEYDWDAMERDALSVLDLDADRCMADSLAGRLATYLSVDFERVSAVFPEWPTSIYVEPTADHARTLPTLVSVLTQPYLHSGRPDRDAAAGSRRERAIDASHPAGDSFATIDPPDPRSEPAAPFVGWMGPDPMADAYRLSPIAIENRERYVGRADPVAVDVVAPANGLEAVCEDATEYYTSDPNVSVDVAVHRDPDRDALEAVFDRGTDLLHVLGPCRDGIPSADGPIRPAAVEDFAAKTVFLDDTGAATLAAECLEAGSVVCLTWPNSAGDDLPANASPSDRAAALASPPATAVRSSLLKCLTGGFRTELARRYANLAAESWPSPLVYGDGTLPLSDVGQGDVLPLEIRSVRDGTVSVALPVRLVEPGITFGGPPLDRWQFAGSTFSVRLDWAQLNQLLATGQYLIFHEGAIYRPDEIGPFYPLV
ncbi:hypothetical protein [Halovivax limisalsi]|uniref:hypothetical protein n=1 Tax=Halovivax limisalsi TaxID=1453760 RepID=UPI001FFDA4D3|nr:hypothetical protein [Halovivax limisalsi]